MLVVQRINKGSTQIKEESSIIFLEQDAHRAEDQQRPCTNKRRIIHHLPGAGCSSCRGSTKTPIIIAIVRVAMDGVLYRLNKIKIAN
ncbi:hypothetical protein V1478_006278 [Vespula squamosa]|uniref:Uncharacterized protein n=1 Tax=Vespula squamosa TaxID=30214 RepID=A0ABD2B7F0_VESSQ